jgi:hypothetical protein
MKTTIDISDHILARARRIAREQQVTLRSLTEEGLLRIIEDRMARKSCTITPITFRGEGLSPEFQDASWERIRGAAYEGHGA